MRAARYSKKKMMMRLADWGNGWLFLALLLLGLHVQALALDFYIDDPGLYALLTRNMVQSGDYLQLQLQRADWLDKPHFPFWMGALSFRLLGISSWASKLPLLIALLGVCGYLYAFVRQRHGADSAGLTICVLLSAQYTVLNSSEGRAENWVMLALMGAAFHLSKALEVRDTTRALLHVCAMGAWSAMGMMTKGTFVPLMVLASGGLTVAYHRSWRRLPLLLLGLPVMAVCVLPELYALHVQFDAHPEKQLSGIRWFLWDSQFSRFINQGPITRNSGNVFFFFHTSLWAFLPWSLVLWPAWWWQGKALVQGWRAGSTVSTAETISFWFSTVGFLLFSLSKFQLPHYLSVLFPFFSVMTAGWFRGLKNSSWMFPLQCTVAGLLVVGIVALQWYVAPPRGWELALVAIAFGAVILRVDRRPLPQRFVTVGVLSSLVVNVWMQGAFFPLLSQMRGDVQAARWLNANAKEGAVWVWGDLVSSRFDFLVHSDVKRIEGEMSWEEMPPRVWLVTNSKEKREAIEQQGHHVKPRASWKHYPSEKLRRGFLDSRTRDNELEEFFVYEWSNPSLNLGR